MVKKGEVFGFLGPNGAGKSTTIRHLIGFSKPDKGNTYILGEPTFNKHYEILNHIGYIPGEIAFPDLKTDIDFLKCLAEFLNMKNMDYAYELIKRLALMEKLL